MLIDAPLEATPSSPSRWARFLKWVNWAFVIAALLCLPLAFRGSRANAGFIVAAGLLVFQVCWGLIPTVLCIRREPLTTRARASLLVPAIVAPCIAAAAAITSLLTYEGGC